MVIESLQSLHYHSIIFLTLKSQAHLMDPVAVPPQAKPEEEAPRYSRGSHQVAGALLRPSLAEDVSDFSCFILFPYSKISKASGPNISKEVH